MMTRTPLRSKQSYRHEAFLCRDPADFTASMVAFVDDGLKAGEPVMVAVTPQHTRWLREALSRPDKVDFVDMAKLGRNPARIIPAWREFVTARSTPSHPVRGIGEPIWPDRHAEELLECQLHEALLNVAIDPETPLWLICPYDVGALSPAVVDEAHRSHPVIVESGIHRGSAHYAGRAHVDTLFAAELARPGARAREAVFTNVTVDRLPGYVKLELYVAGLTVDQAGHLAAATKRLAIDSLHRGSTQVTIRIWKETYALICEVTDDAHVTDPLTGRNPPAKEHEGLWQANQASDLVQLRSTPAGTIIRILTWT
jgi:hypothetical protein